MIDAREIIAKAIKEHRASLAAAVANQIVYQLESAGYRLLGPDEVDPVTVEKAAEVADKRVRMAPQVSHEAAMALLIALPDAIRALGRKA